MASSMCSISVKTTGPLAADQHVFLEAAGLLQARMSREGFDGEVHVLLDLGGILQRIRARHPHAFVQRDADAVRELLQRHGAVLVVIVFGECGGHVRGRVSGLQLLESGVHRIVHFAVQIDFLLRHLHALRAAALEAAHEVDEVAGRTDGVDVHDHQVALADQFVRGPAAVRAGVAARGDDDVVNDFAAALEHELVHFGFDFALAHAGLQPFVLDLPHRGVADAGGLLEQFDFIARLDHARLRNGRPAVHDLQAGLLKRFERGHVKVVDADALLGRRRALSARP